MLTRWNPWRELLDVEREMSDLTRRFVGTGWFGPSLRQGNGSTWMPPVDVFSRQGDLVVRVEIPGVDPEKDIDVSVQDNVLTVRGERRSEQRSERENVYRFESSYGAFERSVPLPEGVKAEDVAASYEHGVLEVVVPKGAELPSAKKIAISVGEKKKALTTKGEKKK